MAPYYVKDMNDDDKAAQARLSLGKHLSDKGCKYVNVYIEKRGSFLSKKTVLMAETYDEADWVHIPKTWEGFEVEGMISVDSE